MFLFKEGSARELLSQLYVIFIRIQGSISFVVDKENAILTLFSSIRNRCRQMLEAFKPRI